MGHAVCRLLCGNIRIIAPQLYMSAYRATHKFDADEKVLSSPAHTIFAICYTYHINLLLVSARLRVVGTRSTDDVHLPSWGHYHTINTRDQHCISLDFSNNSVHFSSIPFLCQTTYRWETMAGGFWPFTLFYTSQDENVYTGVHDCREGCRGVGGR